MAILSDSGGLEGHTGLSETFTAQDTGNRAQQPGRAPLGWGTNQPHTDPGHQLNSAGGVGREGVASPQDRTNNVIIQSGKEPLWPVTTMTAITTL